jgi:hypothetical protein
MSGYYVLDGDKPIQVASLEEWSSWYLRSDREVARTTLADGATVTTEFVGVDQRPPDDPTATPLLFETWTFDANWRGSSSRRYATWRQARLGHRAAVRRRIRRLG